MRREYSIPVKGISCESIPPKIKKREWQRESHFPRDVLRRSIFEDTGRSGKVVVKDSTDATLHPSDDAVIDIEFNS